LTPPVVAAAVRTTRSTAAPLVAVTVSCVHVFATKATDPPTVAAPTFTAEEFWYWADSATVCAFDARTHIWWLYWVAAVNPVWV
jgi:hypothetical protein